MSSILTSADQGDGEFEYPRYFPLAKRLQWASARLFFYACVGLSLGTVVAGPLLAPLISWWMFGDWRFWRHLRRGLRLYAHGYRVLGLVLRGDHAFMFSVPLTSPPLTAPLPGSVQLNASWSHGRGCGSCTRCCRHGGTVDCPVLDRDKGQCVGYDAFFWRYFNCGRFPSRQREIDYYGCPKWSVRRGNDGMREIAVAPPEVAVPFDMSKDCAETG